MREGQRHRLRLKVNVVAPDDEIRPHASPIKANRSRGRDAKPRNSRRELAELPKGITAGDAGSHREPKEHPHGLEPLEPARHQRTTGKDAPLRRCPGERERIPQVAAVTITKFASPKSRPSASFHGPGWPAAEYRGRCIRPPRARETHVSLLRAMQESTTYPRSGAAVNRPVCPLPLSPVAVA